eukprot:364955-Chlamydomonas_euryale.AAC.11
MPHTLHPTRAPHAPPPQVPVFQNAAFATLLDSYGEIASQSPESIAAIGCRCAACDANAGDDGARLVNYLSELFHGNKVWREWMCRRVFNGRWQGTLRQEPSLLLPPFLVLQYLLFKYVGAANGSSRTYGGFPFQRMSLIILG